MREETTNLISEESGLPSVKLRIAAEEKATLISFENYFGMNTISQWQNSTSETLCVS